MHAIFFYEIRNCGIAFLIRNVYVSVAETQKRVFDVPQWNKLSDLLLIAGRKILGKTLIDPAGTSPCDRVYDSVGIFMKNDLGCQ